MNIERYVTHPLRGTALEAAAGAFLARAGRRVLRKNLHPSIEELAGLSDGFVTDPSQLLLEGDALRDAGFDAAALDELRAEHEQVQADLAARYESTRLALPTIWAVEGGTSFLLYALVRRLQPESVIEMGVGNGQSSYLILRALEANGKGTLHSFDVLSSAGGLVGDAQRERWDFRLVEQRRSADNLVAQLGELPRAQLCFHDADHGYLAQFFELQQLWRKLDDRGVLVVDDVDASYGIIDFCRGIGRRPDLLVDGRKIIGFLSAASPPLA